MKSAEIPIFIFQTFYRSTQLYQYDNEEVWVHHINCKGLDRAIIKYFNNDLHALTGNRTRVLSLEGWDAASTPSTLVAKKSVKYLAIKINILDNNTQQQVKRMAITTRWTQPTPIIIIFCFVEMVDQ